jgi:hypothetical protein
MEGLLLIAAILLIIVLLAANKPSKPTALRCPVEHSDQDDSEVRYYDRHGKIRQETDGCNDCIRTRAEQLQARDVTLVKVVLGKKNTGQL